MMAGCEQEGDKLGFGILGEEGIVDREIT